MKKLLCVLLILAELAIPLWGTAENLDADLEEVTVTEVKQHLKNEVIPSEPQWIGITSTSCRIYVEPDKESQALARIPQSRKFRLYAYYPSWAYVEYDGTKGYIRRNCIESAETIDPSVSAPYGVEFYPYTAFIKDEAPVLAEPDEDAEVLITLYEGAKVAFLGFENGYGKLIYHRQYGYINSNRIYQAIPTYPDPETSGSDRPISAFVSFYKITDDDANIGRMANIAVACGKLSAMVFEPGISLDFNAQIGPYNAANGYEKAIVLVDGEAKINFGGGTCQVSSTLYNAILQLPGLTVIRRVPHGPSGASYLPHGVDAAVGNSKRGINFIFRNDYPFPVRIDASSQDGALYMAVYRVDE